MSYDDIMIYKMLPLYSSAMLNLKVAGNCMKWI